MPRRAGQPKPVGRSSSTTSVVDVWWLESRPVSPSRWRAPVSVLSRPDGMARPSQTPPTSPGAARRTRSPLHPMARSCPSHPERVKGGCAVAPRCPTGPLDPTPSPSRARCSAISAAGEMRPHHRATGQGCHDLEHLADEHPPCACQRCACRPERPAPPCAAAPCARGPRVSLRIGGRIRWEADEGPATAQPGDEPLPPLA